MDPLRIGIIGSGDITRAHLWGYWAMAQAGHTDFEIAALCSRTKPKSEQYFARQLKGEQPAEFAADASPRVRSYKAGPIGVGDLPQGKAPDYHADWRELIARDDLDAIEIHAPPAMHHTVAVEALRAGKHVFLEKPMTVTVRGSHRVAEVARQTGLKVAVGTNYCFDPGPRSAEYLLTAGRLGRVRIFHSKTFRGPGHWTRPVGSKLRKALHAVRDKVLYRKPGAMAPPVGPRWRYQKTQVGAGELTENGVHLLDTAMHLCGPIDRAFGVLQQLEAIRIEQPDGSIGESENFDTFTTLLRFARGGMGQIAISGGVHGEPLMPRENFMIYGDEGSCSHMRCELRDGTKADPWDVMQNEMDAGQRQVWFPGGLTHRFGLQKLDWLAAIREDRAPVVDHERGLEVEAACYAVAESHFLGREVTVAEVLDGSVSGFQDPIDAGLGLLEPDTAERA